MGQNLLEVVLRYETIRSTVLLRLVPSAYRRRIDAQDARRSSHPTKFLDYQLGRRHVFPFRDNYV